MSDLDFSIGLAVGVQTALGTPNATIAALTGALTSADGIVLGDRESGDAESGITVPNYDRIAREVARVPASFTEQDDSFLRLAVTSLAITWQMKGNGATATPAAGEAKPLAGIDALLEMAGLIGANGTNPVYEYTPRHAGSAAPGATRYGTIKHWMGDMSWVYQDCILDSLVIVPTPGDLALVTANIKVGSHDPATQFNGADTFPTFDYTTQASLSAPVVQGVAHAWGTTRGFESMTITIENDTSDVQDSNQANGLRAVQNGRKVTAAGTVFVDDADSDMEFQNAIATVAPTVDLSFQLGDVAGATDTINAWLVELNNLRVSTMKLNKLGAVTAVEFTAKSTGVTAGSEAKLTAN